MDYVISCPHRSSVGPKLRSNRSTDLLLSLLEPLHLYPEMLQYRLASQEIPNPFPETLNSLRNLSSWSWKSCQWGELSLM